MRTFHCLALAMSTAFCSSAYALSAGCPEGFDAFAHKEYAEAVLNLTRCLEGRPQVSKRVLVLKVRARSYWELKQPDLALKDQKDFIGLQKPKDKWPLINLAVFHRELKQYDEALAVLKEAEKYDDVDDPATGPSMPIAYHTGWTLHEAGRFAEAIDVLTRGIPKQPDYGWALYRRALSYEALGNKEQAKRDLMRAADLGPKAGYEPEIIAKFKEYDLEARARMN